MAQIILKGHGGWWFLLDRKAFSGLNVFAHQKWRKIRSFVAERERTEKEKEEKPPSETNQVRSN
eukprot:6172153-Pleurochrysis_carterae.AAC.3